MIVRTTVKSIQDIMRQDVGVDGDAQRISQLTWMFFLKIIDDQDQELELTKDGYRSPIPKKFQWRKPSEEPAAASAMDVGREIGQEAHLLFPGGARIEEGPWQYVEAVTQTAALMSEARVPAIFEAAFEYDGIRVRVDVLQHLAPGIYRVDVRLGSKPEKLKESICFPLFIQ